MNASASRRFHLGRIAQEFAYAIAGLPLGIVAFTVILTGQSTAWSLMILVVGAPLLVATFYAGQYIAAFHRWFAEMVGGRPIPAPPRAVPATPGVLRAWWTRFADPVTWREQAHAIVKLPLGIMTFTVATTVWSLTLGLPLTAVLAGAGVEVDVWLGESGNRVDRWWEYAGLVVIGLFFALLAPIATRAVVTLDLLATRALLGASRRELEARTTRLAVARDRSVDAAAAERRRIERDLHDGAQAQLVTLAMDLGRARARLETSGDTEAAAIVAEAHEQAKQVLADVRDLARGIHPAILRDRGIDAALSALAARSPVPVQVDVDVTPRPPEAIEGIAYFVVAEALTNVTRHAEAQHAWVTVRRDGDLLRVEVRDDGRGGATPGAGSGLTGLTDRVASVDGHLDLDSPAGGGTRVRVELPCA